MSSHVSVINMDNQNLQPEISDNANDHAVIRNEHIKEVISELIKNGSIELTGRKNEISEAKDILYYGMRVFIPSLPKQSLLSILDRLHVLHEAGFDPVPHIATMKQTGLEMSERYKKTSLGGLAVTITEC